MGLLQLILAIVLTLVVIGVASITWWAGLLTYLGIGIVVAWWSMAYEEVVGPGPMVLWFYFIMRALLWPVILLTP